MARILVVEDETDIRALVVRRLQRGGHRVQEANGAAEATGVVAAKGNPDVVVLDVNLPEMDGFELLRRLRQQTGKRDLSAVFLSGRMQPDDIAAGRALGATYLTKPFAGNPLLAAIDKLLEKEAERLLTGEEW